MQILWIMRLWKCEFCEKWDFEIVDFVKNETLKMRILSKSEILKCEFLDKLRILAPVCQPNYTLTPQGQANFETRMGQKWNYILNSSFVAHVLPWLLLHFSRPVSWRSYAFGIEDPCFHMMFLSLFTMQSIIWQSFHL